MTDSSAPAPPPPPSPLAARYDHSRVHVGGIYWFILGFILTGIAILLLLWWMEAAMLKNHTPTPLANPLNLPQPLQPSAGHDKLPWEDLAALKHAQLERLHSYGPLTVLTTSTPATQSAPQASAASRDSAHVHIPIDRAIDLLLSSGELQKPWVNPTTHPYRIETQPTPRIKPSVENRS